MGAKLQTHDIGKTAGEVALVFLSGGSIIRPGSARDL